MKSQNVSLLSDAVFHLVIYSNLFSLKVKIQIRSAFYSFWAIIQKFLFVLYLFAYIS